MSNEQSNEIPIPLDNGVIKLEREENSAIRIKLRSKACASCKISSPQLTLDLSCSRYSKLNAGAQTLHSRFSLHSLPLVSASLNNECLESASGQIQFGMLYLHISPKLHDSFRRRSWLLTHANGLVTRSVRGCGGERGNSGPEPSTNHPKTTGPRLSLGYTKGFEIFCTTEHCLSLISSASVTSPCGFHLRWCDCQHEALSGSADTIALLEL